VWTYCTTCCELAIDFRFVVHLFYSLYVYITWYNKSTTNSSKWSLGPNSKQSSEGPDPTGAAYSAPPDPIAGVEGLAATSPKPHPHSQPFGLRASALRIYLLLRAPIRALQIGIILASNTPLCETLNKQFTAPHAVHCSYL